MPKPIRAWGITLKARSEGVIAEARLADGPRHIPESVTRLVPWRAAI